jgi:hypothetical protein
VVRCGISFGACSAGAAGAGGAAGRGCWAAALESASHTAPAINHETLFSLCIG